MKIIVFFAMALQNLKRLQLQIDQHSHQFPSSELQLKAVGFAFYEKNLSLTIKKTFIT